MNGMAIWNESVIEKENGNRTVYDLWVEEKATLRKGREARVD